MTKQDKTEVVEFVRQISKYWEQGHSTESAFDMHFRGKLADQSDKPNFTKQIIDFIHGEIGLGFLPESYKERFDWYVDTYFTEGQPDKPTEWVSVEERLPEEGEPVLCDTIYGVQRGFRRKGGWSFSNGGTERQIEYWMPLPAPPQKQKP